jgi:hypothetical protein
MHAAVTAPEPAVIVAAMPEIALMVTPERPPMMSMMHYAISDMVRYIIYKIYLERSSPSTPACGLSSA